MTRKLTQEQALLKCYQRSSTNDHSKVVYVNNKKKIIVGCPSHGDFQTTPNRYWSGQGCSVCGGNIKLTQQEATAKCEAAHPENDHSKVVYTGNKKKITVGCLQHGDFQITPNTYWRGTGCAKCAIEASAARQTLSQEEATAKCEAAHPENDHSQVVYTRNKKKITVGCPEHGDFQTTPDRYWRGHGCAECAIEASAARQTLSQEEATAKCEAAHPENDHSKVVYVNSSTKIIVGCSQHGEFEMTPSGYWSGRNCPRCASNASKDNVIYIWRVLGGQFNSHPVYKIGRTSDHIMERRVKEVANAGSLGYEIITMVETQGSAKMLETRLLKLGEHPEYEVFHGSSEFRALCPQQLGFALQLIVAERLHLPRN